MTPKISSTLPLDDDALIEATLAGESDAFGKLVLKHQSALKAFALRMLRNQEETEDIVQQVFVEAFRHLVDFRHGSQFSTWLYSITLNRVRNHVRRYKNRTIVALDATHIDSPGAPLVDLPETTPSAEVVLEKRMDLEWIRNEVDTLPAEYRQIFRLRYFQNLSVQQVAQRVGRPLGTVKVYLHRARKELFQRKRSSDPAAANHSDGNVT